MACERKQMEHGLGMSSPRNALLTPSPLKRATLLQLPDSIKHLTGTATSPSTMPAQLPGSPHSVPLPEPCTDDFDYLNPDSAVGRLKRGRSSAPRPKPRLMSALSPVVQHSKSARPRLNNGKPTPPPLPSSVAQRPKSASPLLSNGKPTPPPLPNRTTRDLPTPPPRVRIPAPGESAKATDTGST